MRGISVRSAATALLLSSFLTLSIWTPGTHAATNTCFSETGLCIDPLFANHWGQWGGLAQFGYPLGDAQTEVLEDGNAYTVQYFERARLAYHPDNARPFDVQSSPLGRRFLSSGVNTAELRIDPAFAAYLSQQNGSALSIGVPLAAAFTETLEDGRPYRVQYFEYARLEWHPENPAPYNVLIGQLGRRAQAESGH